MEEKKKEMDFAAMKEWLKEHGLTFKLEGWNCCIMDTILIYRGEELVYEGDYNQNVDYINVVRHIENGDAPQSDGFLMSDGRLV